MTVKVRFAPSPTGRLHVGNVRTALMNWLYAKSHGGRFLLRLDDTDTERSTEEYAKGILEDLAWLGLTHDELAHQSHRFARYDEAARRLKEEGHLYPCYETGEELERKRKLLRARGRPPVYDRAALKLSEADRKALEAEGRRPHWRFKLSGEKVTWTDLIRGEVSIDTASVSDPILVREDGTYLYTLPSVVDDMDFAISDIIRGEDHVTNSGAQIEIFRALGAEPPRFGHHPLLTGAGGEALSKRLGSLSIQSLRDEGIEAMAINSLLARIGTSDAVEPFLSLEDLVASFSLDKLNRAPAKFDSEELRALNAKLLHHMPYEQVAERLKALGITQAEALWLAVRANISRLEEVLDWWRVVTGPITPVLDDAELTARAAELLPEGELDEQSWGRWTAAVKEATGASGRSLFMPLRLALTGQKRGPEMAKILPLIGRDKARARLLGQTA